MLYLGDDDRKYRIVRYPAAPVKAAGAPPMAAGPVTGSAEYRKGVIRQMKLPESDFICPGKKNTGYRGRALEHSWVRIICDIPLLT